MGFSSWLVNVPKTAEDWNLWSLQHRLSHDAIREALLKQGKPTGVYLLDPIYEDEIENWLQRNSQTHIEQTAALGIQSHDIADVDFNDEAATIAWIMVHWQEHHDMERALGI